MTNAEYMQQIDDIAIIRSAAMRLHEIKERIRGEDSPFGLACDQIAADVERLANRMRIRLHRQLPALTTSNPAYYEREHELLIAATREEEPV